MSIVCDGIVYRMFTSQRDHVQIVSTRADSEYSMWSLVRAFSENDKIFRRDKKTLNNERYRDLLISILSYDEVSAFLLWVKARN